MARMACFAASRAQSRRLLLVAGSCVAALLLTTFAWGQPLRPGQVAVSVDNGNNLRTAGGRDHKTARILGTLDAGDWVRVLGLENAWAEVERYDGKRGFVHVKCLVPVEQYIAAQKDPGEFRCSREMPRRFEADLGGGAGRGVVALEDVPDLFGGGARIRVLSASGDTLWLGPVGDVYDVRGPANPLYFYCHHSGVSWPELVGNLDGGAQVEILAPIGQSDVSVSAFNRLRWNGKAFEPVFAGRSLVESPKGSGRFVFERYEGNSLGVRWVMAFVKWRGPGEAEAAIDEYVQKGDGTELLVGKAVLRFTPEGARLVNWIEPLRAAP
ncbi:SH3 type 3 domain protein [Solidesulfovibrio carbinoliphilus subsp. oakridgensis]|uniref:SH3 type 3 domain protein n=1 Tax=Solidesulfovibrio carbinoliphilus subsp. oakridgensis TaxID=694327 RepID=G7Q7N0_9BACT|nr:SH3 domain-containing protein [Solidesulfovibrio carbinoliphilus]EHJ47339.1 SH3 type 3 domain protein [Solidesulfovibrio carbinoliphilus subsp. oakridgensis]